jgi:Flp pilus assembly protein TadD
VYSTLAFALVKRGDVNQAIEYYKKAIQLNPDHYQAHTNLAMLLAEKGQATEAVVHFMETVRLNPNQPDVLNYLAWILAVYPDLPVHNLKQAVHFAEKACKLTGYKHPRLLDTLAVAYAANGQFDKAITTAEKAIDLAFSAGHKEEAEMIRKRLMLYQNSQPYQEK